QHRKPAHVAPCLAEELPHHWNWLLVRGKPRPDSTAKGTTESLTFARLYLHLDSRAPLCGVEFSTGDARRRAHGTAGGITSRTVKLTMLWESTRIDSGKDLAGTYSRMKTCPLLRGYSGVCCLGTFVVSLDFELHWG